MCAGRNSKVRRLRFGETYLLLQIPGKSKVWFIVDRNCEVVRAGDKYVRASHMET